MPPSSSSLTLVHWNARGLASNFEELLLFLQSSPDLVFISETRLSPSSSLSFPGYSVLRVDPPSPSCGGLACLVTSSLSSFFSPLPSPSPSPFFSFFRLLSHPFPLTLASVYFPPSSPLSLLSDFAAALRSLPPPWLVVGDFNAHHPLWGSPSPCPRGSLLESLLPSLGLFVLNSGLPTFLSSSHGTFSHIDLALASPSVARLANWSVHSDSLGSDHFPCIVELTLHRPDTLHHSPSVWILRRADWTSFRQELDQFLDSHPPPDNAPFDLLYTLFTDAVRHAASVAVPTRRPGPSRRPLVPWWSPACSAAVRAKRAAYRRLRHSSTPANLASYRSRCAAARRTVKAAKSAFWSQFCNSLTFRTPLSKIWKHLSTPAFNRPSSAAILPELCLSDKFRELQRAFTSDIPLQTLTPQRLHHTSTLVSGILSDHCPCTSPLCLPFSGHELEMALDRLHVSAPGPDSFPPSFLLNLTDRAKSFLLSLFNQSLASGAVPASWSRSIIVPFPKPFRSPNSPSSFRPISLTSSLCRLMERMLLQRLHWFFIATEHLPRFQCGFLPGRSVLHGHLNLEHDIRTGFQHRTDTLVCFLDLERAYDSVWHHGLLLKCHRLGVPLCFLKWLHAFLSNRTSQIRILSSLSDTFPVPFGAPQGGVLSPLLFNIMISDLPDALPPGVRYSLFADDLAIWVTGKNLPLIACHLQDALDSLSQWALDWGFRFSPQKSSVVLFSRRQHDVPVPVLRMDGHRIPCNTSHRFLGVIFDRRLTWTPHLDHIRAICCRKMHLLRFLCGQTWGASRAMLIHLYKLFIRPHLEFGAPLFLHASNSFLHGIETLQAQALRIATGLPQSTPHIALQVETGIVPVRIRLHQLATRWTARTVFSTSHSPLSTLFRQYLSAPSLTWRFTPPAIAHCASLIRPFLPDLPPFPSPLSSPTWLLRPLRILLPPLPPRSSLDSSALRALFFEFSAPLFDTFTHIYTDGSFDPSSGASSSSVYVPSSNTSISLALPPHTGIFLSELFAISQALLFLRDSPPQNYVIFSDSLSALVSLQHCHSRLEHSIHQDILLAHHQLVCRGFHIVLCWVPAHCGISGNETADRLASSPTSSAPFVYPPNVHHIVSSVTFPFLQAWQTAWSTGHTARALFEVKPTVKPWKHFNDGPRTITTTLARLRTGHNRLHHSLHVHGADIQPTCRFPRCSALETSQHILLECHFLRLNRQRFLQQFIQQCPSDLPVMSFLLAGGTPPFNHSRPMFSAIVQFLLASGLSV